MPPDCVASIAAADFDLTNASPLSGDAGRLLYSWRQHAKDAEDEGDPFEAFIFNWIAFNGWAERVTGQEGDRVWIDMLAKSPDLRQLFTNLQADRDFDQAVRHFAALWPISKASKQRELNIPVYAQRSDLIAASIKAGIPHAPQCQHVLHGGNSPLDWPHTLHALYRVRCNLFHGEKSILVDADRDIVDAANNVLSAFLEGSNLLN